MFGDLNKVEVLGNITGDVELRKTNSGTSFCKFGLATNRRFQSNDEWKEEVEYHNIIIWGTRAENLVKRIKKGTRLLIEGRLRTSSWEDESGSKRYRTEIHVERVILIDRFVRGQIESAKKSEDSSAKEPPVKEPEAEKVDPEDLPF